MNTTQPLGKTIDDLPNSVLERIFSIYKSDSSNLGDFSPIPQVSKRWYQVSMPLVNGNSVGGAAVETQASEELWIERYLKKSEEAFFHQVGVGKE
jgi:hypothetical protein